MKRPAVQPILVLAFVCALLLAVAGCWAAGGAAGAAVIPVRPGSFAQKAQSGLGFLAFLLLCAGIGRLNRGGRGFFIAWRTVVWGCALQFAFALLVLDTAAGRAGFQAVNEGVMALLRFAAEGAAFVFGGLVNNNVPVGIPQGDPLSGPVLHATAWAHTGAYFAFSVLPTIIFFSSLSALLYHMGVMQWVVKGIAWVMQRSMRTSGAETLSSAANIFLGQGEAPLMVKPFLAGATRSELMAIMVGGFANIASGVLAAYVAMLKGFIPDIAGHLLAASLISAPCSLVVAKLLLPETGQPETSGTVHLTMERTDANAVDAAGRGALDGANICLNVGAMLIAFVALVAMANALIGWGAGLLGWHGVTMESLLGVLMAPFAWLMGVPWHDAPAVGSLVGVKTVLNEFVAYLQLAGQLGAHPGAMAGRSVVITAYALCGFANFGSVAMQIGSIGAMAPARRGDLARLGLYAMLGGMLSSFMTACVVGILI